MVGFWKGTGISWTICKQSAPRSRLITTPAPHHSIFTGRMLFLTPNQQSQSTEVITLFTSGLLVLWIFTRNGHELSTQTSGINLLSSMMSLSACSWDKSMMCLLASSWYKSMMCLSASSSDKFMIIYDELFSMQLG